MTLFATTFGAVLIVFLLAFALMGIKVILKPGGEFKKNCGGGSDGSCTHCGRPADNHCENHGTGNCEHEAAELQGTNS